MRVYAPDGACLAERRTVYDQNAAYDQPPTHGLVTRSAQAISACSDTPAIDDYDPAWSVTRLHYDRWGNLARTFFHHLSKNRGRLSKVVDWWRSDDRDCDDGHCSR